MNLIPVPLRRFKVDPKLRLEAWKQVKEVVLITGTEVKLGLIGQPKYVEEFRPQPAKSKFPGKPSVNQEARIPLYWSLCRKAI